jgi:large subunit ribosomal protein L9
MKVYLQKDVAKVGLAGEIVKVSEGYALNFLFPRKLAVQITSKNEKFYTEKQRVVEHRKEVLESNTSMLAEKIKSTKLTLKRKTHNKEKLYGSVSPLEVVDLLAERGIKISKSQVIFDKSIKEKGTYDITIKLSSRLQPQLKLTILSEV